MDGIQKMQEQFSDMSTDGLYTENAGALSDMSTDGLYTENAGALSDMSTDGRTDICSSVIAPRQ